MGTASANLEDLDAFVTAATTLHTNLKSRVDQLRQQYDAYQLSGSLTVSNADLMNLELPGFVGNQARDVTFVALVRAAFEAAGATPTGDGRVQVDAAAFAQAFDAVARNNGLDPATFLTEREPITVDVPIAAGVPQTSGWVNDPVCTATGHFLEAEDDFTWPDRLALLRWRRTYSSRFVAEGPFGRGWASWASVALVPDDDGTVAYVGPDGQMAVLSPDGTGGFGRVSGLPARLASRPEGGWDLVWDRESARPGEVWTFDGDGRVRTASGPATGTVTFGYAGGLLVSLTHEGGRRLDITWDGPRIVAVVSSCGRAARYRYDDAGDLVGVARVLGARRYETDDGGRIVEVWDADGVRLCRNTYDDEGRVVAQVSPFGRETRFAYHPGNRTVVSDTTDGPVSIFEHDRAGRLVGLVDHHGHRMERSFDPEGRCVEATGFDGGRRVQEFAPDGSSASVRGPGGLEQRWQYDEAGRVTGHEVVGGPRLAFDYPDDSPFPARITGPDGWQVQVEVVDGLLRSLTDADGVAVSFEHDDDGNVVAATNGVGATTHTDVHVSGLPARVTYPDGAVYEVERDDAGRMLALRTPTGGEYQIEWTPAGRLKGMVDPDGAHTSFEHGAHGALERVVDALGGELALTHDHLERLVGLTAPDGAKWGFTYSALGLLSLVSDPTDATWSYDHDAEGRPVVATNPLGEQVRWRYDGSGRLAAVTDPSGNTTSYTRDTLGRLIAEQGPEGEVTTIERDVWGRPTVVRFPDGDTLTYAYTPAGRVRQITTAEGRGWTSEYDSAGRLVAVTDATGATTTFTWDACDRMVATTSPEGREQRLTYDAGGRVVATTRAGRTWRASYDHAGRATEVTDPTGGVTRYRYDLRGKLVAATDPLGDTVRIRYDERGNPVTVIDPLGSITTTRYDAMRRPVAFTDQLGRTLRVERDAAGRTRRRVLPTGDVVEWRRDRRGLATDVLVNGREAILFTHDRAGRPVLVHEPARNRTFTLTWTAGGRLAALDVDGATMAWERDADGAVVARHDPAGRTTRYARDRAGRLVAAEGDAWGRVELDRDLDGRLVALRAEGTERRWDHDAGGLVVSFHRRGRSGAEVATTLVRDAAGRVVEAHTGGEVTRYGYDQAGQLVSASTPTGAWTWTYDAAGRLVDEVGPDGATAYEYDEAHQLVRVTGPAGVTAFSYDAAGRRTEEAGPGGTRRYGWDGLGRLASVETGGTVHPVDVDALGRLAEYGATTFTWDSRGTVAGLVAVDGREIVTVAGHLVAAARAGGDIVPLDVDWQGTVVDAGRDTDPWGRRRRAGADPTGAAGAGDAPAPGERGDGHDPIGPGFLGELDLGGLTWLRHRAYDPATRTFLAPDPLPGVPGLPVATNPYHYANNDPVGFADPLGLAPLSIDQYNEIRAQETGVKWGNIAMAGLVVGSFFIPGGPLVATLVGAGLGMAPGVINGVTTGNWDAGAILKGAVVGGVAGRVGFAFGGASPTLTGAILRGGAGGFTTGALGQGYDVLPLPGSDGQFNIEDVALDTVIGGATGGMGHRLSTPGQLPPRSADEVYPYIDFTAPGDGFGANSRLATPIPGYQDVIAHGNPDIIAVHGAGGVQPVGAAQAAQRIQNHPEYRPGANIRLVSCSTGAKPDGFAAQLADTMGVNVKAADDLVHAYPDGRLTVGPDPANSTGNWLDFSPKGAQP